MNRLRPMTTAGVPGSVAPMTSNSPAERCARYHNDGICASRCGSLARSGLPDSVIVPSTTQLLEPRALPKDGRSMEDAKALLHELSAAEERKARRSCCSCLCVVFSTGVESFLSVLGRSAALRIVRPLLGYGGNKSAARSTPITENTSWRSSSIE